jgi:hypothetical protein
VSERIRDNHRSLVVFYVLIYGIAYIVDSYYFYYVGASSAGIAMRILSALPFTILAFVVVYGLNRKRDMRSILASVGFRREGILNGFLWANAFLLPIMIFLLGMLLVSGSQSLLANSAVPLPTPPIPSWYPLFASAAWIIGGLAAFPVLQAYPYESLTDIPRKYAIPLIAILWAGLYNASLLTGAFKPDDIIFFGFLFTVAYHKSRNSIGLVAAYVLAEAPLWYVVAETWGVPTYESAILARTFLSMISVATLVFWHYRSRSRPHLCP